MVFKLAIFTLLRSINYVFTSAVVQLVHMIVELLLAVAVLVVFSPHYPTSCVSANLGS